MTIGRIIQKRYQELPKLEGAATLVRRPVTIHRGLLLYLPCQEQELRGLEFAQSGMNKQARNSKTNVANVDTVFISHHHTSSLFKERGALVNQWIVPVQIKDLTTTEMTIWPLTCCEILPSSLSGTTQVSSKYNCWSLSNEKSTGKGKKQRHCMLD